MRHFGPPTVVPEAPGNEILRPARRTEAIFLRRPYVVFEGWNRERASSYRALTKIPGLRAVIDGPRANRQGDSVI